MGEKRGMKALEAWCRKVTDGYRGVKIDNMTTSWRDGLAFCAIIHHFRPDLIDFDNLEKSDIYRNNELAFRIAENSLGIPALLDAEDMVEYEVPDRLSILTYLSQFYRTFAGTSEVYSPTRTLSKRPASTTEHGVSPVLEGPPSKVSLRFGRKEPCKKCGLPVFIAERLLVSGRILFHRTCFRCARCQHQLSLANFYETEGGEYCCETCPDEVLDSSIQDEYKKSEVTSHKDENNLDIIGHAGPDDYSADFELALDESLVRAPHFNEVSEQIKPKFSKSRSDFMSSQLNFPEPQDKDRSFTTSDRKALSSLHQQSFKDKSSDISTQEENSNDHVKSLTSSTSSLRSVGRFNGIQGSERAIAVSAPSIGNDNASEVNTVPEKSRTGIGAISNNTWMNKECIPTIDNPANIDVGSKEVEGSPTSIVKMRLKIFEKGSGDGEERSKVLKTRSNKVFVKDKKEEISTSNLDTLTTEVKTSEHNNTSSAVEDNSERNKNVTTEVKILERIKSVSSEEEDSQRKENLTTEVKISEHIKSVSAGEEDSQRKENLTTEVRISEHIKSVSTGEEDSQRKENLTTEVRISEHCKNVTAGEENSQRMENLDEPEKSLCELDVSEDKSKLVLDELPQTLPVSTKIESNSHRIDLSDENTENKVTEETTTSFNTSEQDVDKREISSDIMNDTGPSDLGSSKIESAREDGEYPEELNPFGEEDEVKEVILKIPEPNLNPFDSSDDEQETHETTKPSSHPVPVARQRTQQTSQKLIEAPKVSLNPFWSDGEEPSSEDEDACSTSKIGEKVPVPRPRTLISVTPEPVPRKTLLTNSNDKFGSLSSLSSLSSSTGGSSRKKKKPAPAPPKVQDLFPDTSTVTSATSSRASSPSASSGHSRSPKVTPRHRKSRPAPLPPKVTTESGGLSFSEAKHVVEELEDASAPAQFSEWEREKNKKDVANRNRQNQPSGPLSPNEQQSLGPNKSTYGQWKRKKGPAPPRPVPQRRQIKAIPMKEVKRELDDIEVQQQELERQGVTLEKTIRDKFDLSSNIDNDSSMTPDIEDLVLQLFELVNEKNELFRRQAELMYLRRQQRLEEEHADLEYQIRCLMEIPEHTKTDSDKTREEELIQRLVEVVEHRNEIVECLEMDRIREAEEDRSIHSRLNLFSKGKILFQDDTFNSKSHSGKKKKGKKHKEKIKKSAKGGLDVDKDIDEVEEAVPKHAKDKKSKKKWF